MNDTRTVLVGELIREKRGRNAAKVQDRSGDVHVMPVAVYDDWKAKIASGRYATDEPFVFMQERRGVRFFKGWYTVHIVSHLEALQLERGEMPEQLTRDGLIAH